MNETLITPAGLSRLSDQLTHLKTTARADIAERLRRAFAIGAEAARSPEYQEVRDEQALLEWRIAELERRLTAAHVAQANPDDDVVDLGELVRVRELDSDTFVDYAVVGPLEADPVGGRISAASPLGRALLGRRRGETVAVDAPAGTFRFEILGIGPGKSGRGTARGGGAVTTSSRPGPG